MPTLKKKPPLYPDLLPREKIIPYILKQTGTRITNRRLNGWINKGELPMMKFPRRQGGGWFTRVCWVDELIRRYS